MGVESQPRSVRAGLLYAVAAYGMWGIVPLYFKNVACPPQEIVAHRVLWSGLFLAVVLTALRRWPDARAAFRSRRTLLMLFASAYLVAGNWLRLRLGHGQRADHPGEPRVLHPPPG